jgi:hypothetical protein
MATFKRALDRRQVAGCHNSSGLTRTRRAISFVAKRDRQVFPSTKNRGSWAVLLGAFFVFR